MFLCCFHYYRYCCYFCSCHYSCLFSFIAVIVVNDSLLLHAVPHTKTFKELKAYIQRLCVYVTVSVTLCALVCSSAQVTDLFTALLFVFRYVYHHPPNSWIWQMTRFTIFSGNLTIFSLPAFAYHIPYEYLPGLRERESHTNESALLYMLSSRLRLAGQYCLLITGTYISSIYIVVCTYIYQKFTTLVETELDIPSLITWLYETVGKT